MIIIFICIGIFIYYLAKIITKSRKRNNKLDHTIINEIVKQNLNLMDKNYHPENDKPEPYKIIIDEINLNNNNNENIKIKPEINKPEELTEIKQIKQIPISFDDPALIEALINQDAKEKFMKRERRKLTKKLRYEILERDRRKCQMCGRTPYEDGVKLEVDHKIPIAKGGRTELNNLWTLCQDCNKGKGKKIFIEPEKEFNTKIYYFAIDELIKIKRKFWRIS